VIDLLLTHDFLLGFGAGAAAVYLLSVTVLLLLVMNDEADFGIKTKEDL